MGAIASYMRGHHPELTVHYTTAERFTSEFVTALRTHGPERFKQRYRGLDALLIDDVQFLEGKERTEEEFVHTFNALFAAGKQIVMSSDRPPGSLVRLEERLRDRFEWGLDGRDRRRPTSARASRFSGASPPTRSTSCPSPTSCARSPTARRATCAGSKVRSPASSPSPPSTTSRSPRARSTRLSARRRASGSCRARIRRRAERRRDPGRGLIRRSASRAPIFSPPSARRPSRGRATSRCSCRASSRRSRSRRSPGSSTAITPPSSTPSGRSSERERARLRHRRGYPQRPCSAWGKLSPPDPEDAGSQHSRVPSTGLINMSIPLRH